MISHVLFGCSEVEDIWHRSVFYSGWKEWQKQPLSDVFSQVCRDFSVEDVEIFCVLAWLIWRNRNMVYHGQEAIGGAKIIETAERFLFEYKSSTNAAALCKAPLVKRVSPATWRPPAAGLLKLNTDAAVVNEGGVTGLGGVIRDTEGEVLGAFSKRVQGCLDVQTAECLAIRAGLIFAMESGLRVAEVESDALNVVRAIQSSSNLSTDEPVLEDIRFLLNAAGGGSCCHVSRNGNMVAHSLATVAFSLGEDCFWLEDFPLCISSFVQADKASLL